MPDTIESIIAILNDILKDKLEVEDEHLQDPTWHFMESDMDLSSLDIAELVQYAEELCSVEIADNEVIPVNNVLMLAELIQRKQHIKETGFHLNRVL